MPWLLHGHNSPTTAVWQTGWNQQHTNENKDPNDKRLTAYLPSTYLISLTSLTNRFNNQQGEARLGQFIAASNAVEDKETASLLTVIGWPTFELLETLWALEKSASKSYNDLRKMQSEHLAP